MKSSVIGNRVGAVGERVVARHLRSQGYEILHLNYRRKYGEIDIVARKASKYHFVEVKSISRAGISRETQIEPEENVHQGKLRRLSRTIQAYLAGVEAEADWQFDVAAVFLDSASKQATIRMVSDEPLG